MKLVSSTLISATALVLALGFTAVQAEPQEGGMSTGNPPAAGNNAGGNPGATDSPAGRPDRLGAAAGNSDPMSSGEGKGKSAEGAMPPEEQSGKNAKDGNEAIGKDNNAAVAGDKGKGKSAEGAMPSEGRGSNDPKPSGKASGKAEGGNTAEGKSATDEDVSGKSKAGATAEGKGDRPGKSVRLESNDVSKVRTYFSQHRPTAHRIDRNQVSVSIGVGIPSAIVLYDLPPDVIVVSGACPIKYFVWEDDIVLVDSCTREVVEVISGIA